MGNLFSDNKKQQHAPAAAPKKAAPGFSPIPNMYKTLEQVQAALRQCGLEYLFSSCILFTFIVGALT